MRLVVLTALLVTLVAGGVTAALDPPKGKHQPTYRLELDNAFGLVKGADLKVAGVRAGKITSLDLDKPSKRAVVGFNVTEKGFGSLRTDATCETRPQSVIGEYFIDCNPGQAAERLKDGGTIPITRSNTTIAPDLVANVLRLPYRERLRLIIAELGAGVGGNGQNLNQALRRAVPALRQTDKVLALLATQTKTLQQLNQNGDRVLTALASKRKDLSRFVTDAGRTAEVSASRASAIAATQRQFPGFLAQLQPTMAALGRVADEQTPALRDLSAASPDLQQLFTTLRPFADASRPALRSLAETADVGRPVVRTAAPTVAALNRLSTDLPELSKNAGMILGHLNDRDNAVQKDVTSPGGKGYTGFESFFMYFFYQALSANIFDEDSYFLKVAAFQNECAPYYDAAKARRFPARYRRCSAILGPSQPGVLQPDPTRPANAKIDDPENAGRDLGVILPTRPDLVDPARPIPGDEKGFGPKYPGTEPPAEGAAAGGEARGAARASGAAKPASAEARSSTPPADAGQSAPPADPQSANDLLNFLMTP